MGPERQKANRLRGNHLAVLTPRLNPAPFFECLLDFHGPSQSQGRMSEGLWQ